LAFIGTPFGLLVLVIFVRLHGQSAKSVCVQYIHFSACVAADSSEPIEVILDGQENMSSLCARSNQASSSVSVAPVRPLLSLNDAATFGDTSVPMGISRYSRLYLLDLPLVGKISNMLSLRFMMHPLLPPRHLERFAALWL
jgi:hypothetical protein